MRKYEPEILMGLILCLSVLVTFRTKPTVQAAAPEPVLAAVELKAEEAASFDESHMLRLQKGEAVEALTLHDYLVGVLMSELTASFDPQALAAQAIASRTFALHCRKHEGADVCADSGCCQCWAEETALRERCGEAYDAFHEKAEAAVAATDGIVLTYQGELIDATFFACSGGRTEDAASVWGGDVPYLRAVDSPGEEDAYCYQSSAEFSPEEFAACIAAISPETELTGDPSTWLGKMQRTAGGGVDTLELGGTALPGTSIRKAFGLRSAKFFLDYADGHFLFEVYGSGHRVGLSQFGAQAMANAGKNYADILKFYYTGVELTSLTP